MPKAGVGMVAVLVDVGGWVSCSVLDEDVVVRMKIKSSNPGGGKGNLEWEGCNSEEEFLVGAVQMRTVLLVNREVGWGSGFGWRGVEWDDPLVVGNCCEV